MMINMLKPLMRSKNQEQFSQAKFPRFPYPNGSLTFNFPITFVRAKEVRTIRNYFRHSVVLHEEPIYLGRNALYSIEVGEATPHNATPDIEQEKFFRIGLQRQVSSEFDLRIGTLEL